MRFIVVLLFWLAAPFSGIIVFIPYAHGTVAAAEASRFIEGDVIAGMCKDICGSSAFSVTVGPRDQVEISDPAQFDISYSGLLGVPVAAALDATLSGWHAPADFRQALDALGEAAVTSPELVADANSLVFGILGTFALVLLARSRAVRQRTALQLKWPRRGKSRPAWRHVRNRRPSLSRGTSNAYMTQKRPS